MFTLYNYRLYIKMEATLLVTKQLYWDLWENGCLSPSIYKLI